MPHPFSPTSAPISAPTSTPTCLPGPDTAPTAGPTAVDRRRPGRRRSARGITTAEYAVGTAAGAGLAGLLYKMLTGGFGDRLLHTLYDHVLRLLGL